MSEEVQERVEDYLGLEQYIEKLRLQRSARLPDNLAPQQTHIYSMALLFHTATPRVADPRPEFISQLGQRLGEQLPAEEQWSGKRLAPVRPTSTQDQKQFRTIFSTLFRSDEVPQRTHISSIHPQGRNAKKRRGMSRRVLGTIAAEILVATGIGAGAGAVIEHSLEPKPTPLQSHPTPTHSNPSLTGNDWHWQPVASVEQLGTEALPFTTGAITGHLIRRIENSTESILAFSAACTHLGCIVQWEKKEREFVCPCHGSTFNEAGAPSPHNIQPYASLPRLETKTENGYIYVKVPSSSTEGYH